MFANETECRKNNKQSSPYHKYIKEKSDIFLKFSRFYQFLEQPEKLCETLLSAGQFDYLQCSTTVSDGVIINLEQPLSKLTSNLSKAK